MNHVASNHDAGSDEFVTGEDGELYRLEPETARKSSPNLGMIRVKATLKVALATLEEIAEPRLTLMDPRNPRHCKMCLCALLD